MNEDDGEQIIGIGFRDTLTNMLGGLFALFMAALVLISPPKEDDDASEPPGNLVASIVWPSGTSDDVDLWIYSEGERRPIGYSNKSGLHWSLLRDDLGTALDSMPANFETAYSRDVVAGHYVINLVCYTCRGPFPVKVVFELRIVQGGNNHAILTTTILLTQPRQEVTVVQFDLDKNGAIVPGSTSSVFKPLFQAWK